MSISTISRSTGNHVFITDPTGRVVACSDMAPTCDHLRMVVPGDALPSVENGMFDELSDLNGLYKLRRYVVSVPILTKGTGTCSAMFS